MIHFFDDTGEEDVDGAEEIAEDTDTEEEIA